MIKIVYSVLLASSLVTANEYFAKIEPINTYNVKSAVSGTINFINEKLESTTVTKDIIVKIDDKVNQIDLKQSKLKLKNLEETVQLETNTLKRFNKVSSKSKFDKDNQKIKILNIQSNISDLKTKIATLEDTIAKKTLIEKQNYIYDIAVEVGDYVNPGTVLYTAMNLEKAKLSIYLPIDQANNIESKTIYLDGVKTDLKISKLYKVTDTKHISSYKCEIELSNPKQFSKLVKVEFK
jgi:multidrug efflux pump subunit AcrA (membrane-fusion protein)